MQQEKPGRLRRSVLVLMSVALVGIGAWITYSKYAHGHDDAAIQLSADGNQSSSTGISAIDSSDLLYEGHDRLSLPAISNSDAAAFSAKFNLANDCVKYRRLSIFFAARKKDPSSYFNNKVAYMLISPEDREDLENNQRFIASNEAKCEAWWQRTGDETSGGLAAFNSALDAALRGNQAAAVCFVFVPWSVPGAGMPGAEEVLHKYRKYARLLVRDGIARGNWAMLSMAAISLRVEHGISIKEDVLPSDAYLYYRLAQLGAPNRESEGAFGARAAELSDQLTARQLEEIELKAERVYKDVFHHTKMSDKELHRSCDA